MITSHYDVDSDTTDVKVTGNGVVHVYGSDLLFDTLDPDCGIYYLKGPPQTPFKMTDIISVDDSEIIGRPPPTIIPLHSYKVSIRTKIAGVLHTFVYPVVLTGELI